MIRNDFSKRLEVCRSRRQCFFAKPAKEMRVEEQCKTIGDMTMIVRIGAEKEKCDGGDIPVVLEGFVHLYWTDGCINKDMLDWFQKH